MVAQRQAVKIAWFWCVVQRPEATTEPPPLLLFLHGAGERGAPDGSELHKVEKHGPWRAEGLEGFLLVAPQCPSGLTWPGLAHRVVALARQMLRRNPGPDPAMVSLAGLSMGAFGCWAAAAAPDLFASVVAVCGGWAPPLPRAVTLREVVGMARVGVPASEV